MTHFIGIEGGGTKFVCTHGTDPKNLHERVVIATETPDKTLPKVLAYIEEIRKKNDIQAIGLACFGPLDLDRESPTYGYITSTGKPGWQQFDIVGAITHATHLPVGFDTDVNGAALAEHYWGAARDLTDFLYLTVGTGIGGGAMVNGQLLHGAMHAEMGHILIPQDMEIDTFFPGVCAFHRNCLEGLASGPAMKERWQVASALDLPAEHEAWDLEASYLGIAVANFTLTLAPKRVIMGGGVMRQQHLIAKIRQKTLAALAHYVHNHTLNDIDNYIVQPSLHEDSGVCGAIALAKLAALTPTLSQQARN